MPKIAPRRRRTTLLVWLILVLSAGASAQQAPAAPQPLPPPPQQQPQAVPGPTPPKPATLAEMVAEGSAVVRKGEGTSRSVRRMLDQARKQADIIRVTCLNDKLTQINANLKTAQARLGALREAVDPDRQAHEHTVLSVVGQKLQVLDREAQQCVGQGMYDTGETKVITEIEEDSLLPFEENPSSPPVLLPPSLPTIPPPATGDQ